MSNLNKKYDNFKPIKMYLFVLENRQLYLVLLAKL